MADAAWILTHAPSPPRAKRIALLAQFCAEVVQPKELKGEQRAQDRSRRATDPDNYDADGTLKRGSRKWQRSNRYQKRQEHSAQ